MKSDRRYQWAMLSDPGRVRGYNEDACAADEDAGLFVVCDGMGGAAAGEVASEMASRILLEQAGRLAAVKDGSESNADPQVTAWLRESLKAANAAVYRESQRHANRRGMGTTLVALCIAPDARTVWTVNVGDSRCYRLRAGHLEQLTEDHSLVEEQVRIGSMTSAEAARSPMRNVITRAVGSHAEVEPDISRLGTEPGDLYLLCSDGLVRELKDQDIQRLLAGGGDLSHMARTLVDEANRMGGEDNITVLLVRIQHGAEIGENA